MPAYATPRHGASLSDALMEAAVAAPIARAMLTTMELYQPVATPAGPIYVVNDFVDLTAFKEAAATRDAGLEVTYMACGLSIVRPEESDQAAAPKLAITAANVSGLFSDALRTARGSLVPWEIVERPYASDDLGGPAILPPLTLYLEAAEVNTNAVLLTASFGDSANVAVPRITFKRTEYPGLVR